MSALIESGHSGHRKIAITKGSNRANNCRRDPDQLVRIDRAEAPAGAAVSDLLITYSCELIVLIAMNVSFMAVIIRELLSLLVRLKEPAQIHCLSIGAALKIGRFKSQTNIYYCFDRTVFAIL